MAPSSLRALLILLSRSASRADVVATRLLRLLSTTRGLDSLLRTIYYSLVVLHSQLTRVLAKRYEQLAISIASKASVQMLPGETLVASIEAPQISLTEYCVRTKAAGDVVDDIRLFLRLRGLLDIYRRAKETYIKGKRDPAIKLLTWARISADTGYQIFENGAYLARKGIFFSEKWQQREAKFWVWSNRCWLAAILLDLVKLARVRQLRYNEEWGAELKVQDESKLKAQSKELEEKWWSSLYADLGWLPSAVHFSYHDAEQSPVSEAWLGATAMVPAIYSLREAWQNAA